MKTQNHLFADIFLVTPDEKGRITTTGHAYVSVRGNTIRYAGQSFEMAVDSFHGAAYERYDGRNRILLPALANTHGHLAMTLFRNQADDRNLQDWLFNVIFPREERLNEEIVYTGTLLGIAEMIRSGTGAAADMYYHDEAVAQAALAAGFRLNFSCDAKDPRPDGQHDLLPQLLADRMERYARHPSDLLRVSLLVHSIYLYEDALYPELAKLAETLNCPVQIHVSETRQEVAECVRKYGCRPPRQLEKFGFFRTPTLAAHCTFLDDDDRAILAKYPVVVAHNPSSNLKLGSGIADLAAMIDAGLNVGLGTDGAGSNNNLDLYREMRLAAFLAKGTTGDAAKLSAGQLLDMASRIGMAGLGFANSGRIAAGTDADLQIINYDVPSMTPLGDPVAALVYSSDASLVESLMVQGRFLLYKGELQTVDEEKLLAEARQAAQRLNA
ncbi:MAG: amidohydrolase family protein [Saccharofermentanales bacterium]|jgi:5-methylthioadenosine/S-adenosylhomocysteine deaminase|nr:amidohydrolase [Clostridiaceae bacterium]